MKLILISVTIALLGQVLAKADPEVISRENLIQAYRELRKANSEFCAGMTTFYEAASFSSKKSKGELEAVRKQHYRLARPYIEKSIKLNPYYAPAYEMLAIILRDAEKNFEGAVQSFSKVIELDPKQESAIAARCELYIQLGKFKEARKDLKALEDSKSTRAISLRRKLKSEQDVAPDGE